MDTSEGRPSANKPEQELTRSEQLFLRISIWQTVLSVVGIFIAGVALFAALTESEAVRRQTAAAVWPYVQLSVEDHLSANAAVFELSLTNAGVGPAHIRAMRVTFHGQAIPTWHEAVSAIDKDGPAFSQMFANNRVLRPGEHVTIFGTRAPALVQALQEAVATKSTAVEYCYCSIFDDCWTVDSRAAAAGPAVVRSCPDYGTDEFLN
jgi:hypothetical protein